jgi:broad specificity phosphatase PhoE
MAAASFTIDLYLVRHGETTANAAKVLQGHSNYFLSESGVQQAGLFGDSFSQTKWDLCLSSDLKRAESTAQIILSKSIYCDSSSHSIALETTPLVREYCLGIRENLPSGTPLEECREIVSKKLGIKPSEVVDGQESEVDMFARQKAFVDFLIAKVSEKLEGLKGEVDVDSAGSEKENVKVLLVSHSGFIRSFLVNICEYPQRVRLRNCSISKVRIRKEGSDLSYHIDPSEINYVIPEIEELSRKVVQEEL